MKWIRHRLRVLQQYTVMIHTHAPWLLAVLRHCVPAYGLSIFERHFIDETQINWFVFVTCFMCYLWPTPIACAFRWLFFFCRVFDIVRNGDELTWPSRCERWLRTISDCSSPRHWESKPAEIPLHILCWIGTKLTTAISICRGEKFRVSLSNVQFLIDVLALTLLVLPTSM